MPEARAGSSLFSVSIPVGDLVACDEAASVAHDFIWGKNRVSKQRRPHLPMDDETRAAVLKEIDRG